MIFNAKKFRAAQDYILACQKEQTDVMRRAYARSLASYLAQYVPVDDAVYLSLKFAERDNEGTSIYWPELVAEATKLKADHAVAGKPVNDASIQRWTYEMNDPVQIPVWGLA